MNGGESVQPQLLLLGDRTSKQPSDNCATASDNSQARNVNPHQNESILFNITVEIPG